MPRMVLIVFGLLSAATLFGAGVSTALGGYGGSIVGCLLSAVISLAFVAPLLLAQEDEESLAQSKDDA